MLKRESDKLCSSLVISKLRDFYVVYFIDEKFPRIRLQFLKTLGLKMEIYYDEYQKFLFI